MTTVYKINWDNGNDACGTFPYEFSTEQEAEDFGNNWVVEMTALTPELDEEEDGYSFDVFEVEKPDEEEGIQDEATIGHFDRYIAGDRCGAIITITDNERTLYAALRAAGIEIDHHESDLYFPETEQTTLILATFPRIKAVRFTSQIDGKPWYDVPFGYLPWWEQRSNRG
jgi:hypothetical protein